MTLLIIIAMILTLSLVGSRSSTKALEVLDSSLQRQNKVTFASIKKQVWYNTPLGKWRKALWITSKN